MDAALNRNSSIGNPAWGGEFGGGAATPRQFRPHSARFQLRSDGGRLAANEPHEPNRARMSGLWWRDGGHYKGQRVHGSPGTQEAAVALLLSHDPPRSSVLDIASGSGVMLLRLKEAGFGDVHAIARTPGKTSGPASQTV